MFKQNEKCIAQIAEYIPRACRVMQLQEAKARLEKKIALYIDDGCDAAVLNAAFAPAAQGGQMSNSLQILCIKDTEGYWMEGEMYPARQL